MEKEVVFKVSISKNEEFVDPLHAVEITTPVSLCNALAACLLAFILMLPQKQLNFYVLC